MAVLIDPPRWPAHGTRFSHLVSDASLDELLIFADASAVPMRAFDHDHCDVPERRYSDLVAAGAEPVSASDLLRRLVASGLRVRTPERTPAVDKVLPGLRRAWTDLLPGADALRERLLQRWQEPHRHYHNVRHLAAMLAALGSLCEGEVPRPLALAAWFHDAVYGGSPGTDERDSASLAAAELSAAGLPAAEVAEVARLILLTVDHSPDAADVAGAQLVDADLSVLGSVPGRYHVYCRDVRLEHPNVSAEAFAAARLALVGEFAARESLFSSGAGERLWAEQARTNLRDEARRWSALLDPSRPQAPDPSSRAL